ncbi:MAG: sulfatase-like hydrolase/transferase [Lacunisphaera sp.]|nr:sulfatase-like hydrolase/transferase [Lacunisphaera sp.]
MQTFVLLPLALLAAAVPVIATHAQSATTPPPNIIFILTDDQRYDTLGITGDKLVQTPNIDRLAGEGTFFANASVTSAICTPSRACYFLGQYERRHGINFNSGTSLAPAAWDLGYPMQLRAHGYFTGYVGKNHVPVGIEGYDTGLIEKSFDFWYAGHDHLGFYPKKRHEIFAHATADTQPEILREGVESFLRTDADFIAGAETFLKRRPAGQPFCLTIAFNVPHAAGTSTMELLPTDPELYRTAYRDQAARISFPPTYVAKDRIQTPRLPPDVLYAQFRQNSYDYVDSPDTLRERIIRETQTITGIDRVVGAVRDALAHIGAAENTIIVFASDHGIMHGEFGLGGKALNYEVCLRVPLIVFDPRLPAAQRGRRTMALVESVDVAPTLLDYAGVTPPSAMQGLSLRPLMEGQAEKLRDSSFAENLWSNYFGNPRIESVRTREWKYIRYFKNDRTLYANVEKKTATGVTPEQVAAYAGWLTSSIRGEQPVYEELFHLTSDPQETANLVGRPLYADVLIRMRAECQRLVTAAKGDPDTPAATIIVPSIREGTRKKAAQPRPG